MTKIHIAALYVGGVVLLYQLSGITQQARSFNTCVDEYRKALAKTHPEYPVLNRQAHAVVYCNGGSPL